MEYNDKPMTQKWNSGVSEMYVDIDAHQLDNRENVRTLSFLFSPVNSYFYLCTQTHYIAFHRGRIFPS